MSNIIDVNIARKESYAVEVGEHLEDSFAAFCRDRYSGRQIFVLIDQKVNNLHRSRIEKMCQPVFEHIYFIEIPEGERSKSVGQWSDCVDTILQTGVERGTPLLAAGGGVTGDLGGFVAASVLRGIPLIHLPTTLLAMVDSSIGGKTGINHAQGKNLIGAFYQPDAVFSDIRFLQTLEDGEWITGMAEILKYAAIRNPDMFEEVRERAEGAFAPDDKWAAIIRQSVRIKTDIVQEDALESGKRAFLNFGHTFGHAIEKVAGYGAISHGEAVFVGMIAGAHFSSLMGHPVSEAPFAPFISLYQKHMGALPRDVEQLTEAMKSDKKVKNNVLRLVLLNEWGSPYIHECTDQDKLKEAWKYALAQFN